MNRRVAAALLLTALVVATALRLHALDAEPWFDEVQTYLRDARRPLGAIATTYESQNQHVLYSLLARLSLDAFGDSVAALRAPAALFGVLGVAALYAFARAMAPVGHALLAAALLATSYHHVWFSQNARGYTMLLFFTLVASLLLLRAMADGGRRRWIAYAVVAALGAWTHLTMLLVVAGHLPIYLRRLAARGARTSRDGLAWGFGLTTVLTALAYAPALPDLAPALSTAGRMDAVGAWSSTRWALGEVVRGLSGAFAGAGLATLAVGVAALGVVRAARERPVLVELAFYPVALTAAALLVTGHHLWPRFFLFALGFATLILVDGAMAVGDAVARALPRLAGGGRAVGTALVLAVVALQLATVPRAWAPKQRYREVLALVDRERAQEDAVVVMGPARLVLLEYYRAPWQRAASGEEFERIRAGAHRTWLVHSFPLAMAALHGDVQRTLDAEFELVGRFAGTLGGGALKVWRSSAEGTKHARATNG